MHKIVIGYDGSESADRALDRAAELLDEAVTSSGQRDSHARRQGRGFDPIEKEDFERQLVKAKARLADAGIAATTVEGMGDPARVIAEQAKQSGADLIVVGNSHKNILERLLFGVRERRRRPSRGLRRPGGALTVPNAPLTSRRTGGESDQPHRARHLRSRLVARRHRGGTPGTRPRRRSGRPDGPHRTRYRRLRASRLAATSAAAGLRNEAQAALEAAKAEAPGASFRLVEGRPDRVLLAEAERERATLLVVERTELPAARVASPASRPSCCTRRRARCSSLAGAPHARRCRGRWSSASTAPRSPGWPGRSAALGGSPGAKAWPVAVRDGKRWIERPWRRSRRTPSSRMATPSTCSRARPSRPTSSSSAAAGRARALGSVSERVAHKARCSVLVVRPPRCREQPPASRRRPRGDRRRRCSTSCRSPGRGRRLGDRDGGRPRPACLVCRAKRAQRRRRC